MKIINVGKLPQSLFSSYFGFLLTRVYTIQSAVVEVHVNQINANF